MIDWSDENLWDFINREKISVCSLYREGFTRCGCIGCPMAGKGRYKEFARWPTYERAYKRAFEKMLSEIRRRKGESYAAAKVWLNAEAVFDWWMEKSIIPGQMEFDMVDGEIVYKEYGKQGGTIESERSY